MLGPYHNAYGVKRMIRFFTVVAPGDAGDLPYRYLRAFVAMDKPICVLPIGPATAMASERRWYELEKLFGAPIDMRTNIVCAPCGYPLGQRATARSMGGTGDLVKQEGRVQDVSLFPPELRVLLKNDVGELRDHDVEYVPPTAFGGLWTAGVQNIAIVLEGTASADEHELAFLAKYDLVICPSYETLKHLTDHNSIASRVHRAHVFTPADLTAVERDAFDCFTKMGGALVDTVGMTIIENNLRAAARTIVLLEDLCFASDGSATGVPSQVSGERLEITSRRLHAALMSKWRLRTSAQSAAANRRARKAATATSTSSWFHSLRRKVKWTWRSFTSRLAFWRRPRSRLAARSESSVSPDSNTSR